LQALRIFKTSPAHLIGVIDEYGDIQGIVTLSNILEAIVGTISSNYSHNKTPNIVNKGDNSWLVDGITSIDEINLEIGIDEINQNQDYETIAGFIQHNTSKEIKEGYVINLFGYSFEIIDMDGHRIDKILVKKLLEKPYNISQE
jgi:putative hemolysin